ncbi:hypothetical protein JCM11491_004586 [Sporobolomyces phaffii]
MVVWLLKLLIVLFNIRSSHKALATANPSHRNRSRPDGARPRPTSRRKRLVGELTNWLVWVVYLMLEKLADQVASWVPLYATFKSFILLLLLLSRGTGGNDRRQGSNVVFDKFVKPSVKAWEPTLDFVAFVVGEVVEIALYCASIVPRWVAHEWNRRRATNEPDVPSILRGLRQQNPTPRVAQSLARSLERSQGHSVRINEKLSRPVTIRLDPVQTHTTTTKKKAVALPAHRLGPPPALPPAAFSTAPFRPVKPSSIPVASTSSSSRAAISSSSSAARAASSSSSLYPSLEFSVPRRPPPPPPPSSPPPRVEPAPARLPPRPASSRTTPTRTSNPSPVVPSLLLPSDAPAPAPAHSSSSSSAVRPTVAVPLGPPPPTPAPPGAFTLDSPPPPDRRSHRLARPGTESSPPTRLALTAIDDDDGGGRSMIGGTGTAAVQGTDRHPPPRRRARAPPSSSSSSTRRKRSLETLVADGDHDDDDDRGGGGGGEYGRREVDVSTPSPRKKKRTESRTASSPDLGGGEQGEETETVARRMSRDLGRGERVVTMTPRQKALGAISRLATDLLVDADDGPLTTKGTTLGAGGMLKRGGTGGRGVLARSTTSARPPPPPPPRNATTVRATRTRTRKQPIEDDGEAEEEHAREPDGPEEPGTKRRKTRARAAADPDTNGDGRDPLGGDTKLSTNDDAAGANGEQPTRGAKRSRTATTARAAAANLSRASSTSSSSRTVTTATTAAAAGEDGPRRSGGGGTRSNPVSAAPRTTTTTLRARSPPPPPPPPAADETIPAVRKRKARRVVLRTTDGTGEFDAGEVEVEGVAVVARRRTRYR